MVWMLSQKPKSGGKKHSVADAGDLAELTGARSKDRIDLALRQRGHDEMQWQRSATEAVEPGFDILDLNAETRVQLVQALLDFGLERGQLGVLLQHIGQSALDDR